MKFTWARFGGHECSSKGDMRFSAMFARMPDGRTIEMHYQCDIKGYQPGGRDWKLGKGKPPLDTTVDLWGAYLTLWRVWAETHVDLMRELYWTASDTGILSDRFATTPINQAHALSTVLNEMFY